MAQETCHVYPLSQSDLACLAPGTVLAAGGGTPLSAQAQVSLRVGAAVRVIMPDPLVPISGGMGTPNPARAVVFQKGDTTLAVVGLDLPGVSLCAGQPGACQGPTHSRKQHPYWCHAHSQCARCLGFSRRQGWPHRQSGLPRPGL